ncbi:pyridoxamine 5'-phosphate oxidase family protein [Kitasatospora sp. NPDC056138]|uniref:pyridoxamine 5'-phosphate oxidase family protein n=1 Tax=Kitasatospora sp. NPDC056138 TaxID=3345724 RepID=UPI0035D53A89
MDRDNRVETLSEAECLRLLGTVPIGRVVYTEQALPAVLPVAFEVGSDGRLVLALRAGTTVTRALDGTVAAFQADQLDPVNRSGWSVLVHGHAEPVRDPGLHEHLLRTGPRPWVSGQEQLFVLITPELVSGRLLLPAGRAVRLS